MQPNSAPGQCPIHRLLVAGSEELPSGATK
jgi:hypothetical protein